jgi:hypothetical protein
MEQSPLDMATVTQQIKKCPTLQGNRILITVFTRVRHRFPSGANKMNYFKLFHRDYNTAVHPTINYTVLAATANGVCRTDYNFRLLLFQNCVFYKKTMKAIHGLCHISFNNIKFLFLKLS